MLPFPYKLIWKVKVLPRVSFFAWEASRECILTIDKLGRRGLILVNACYLCKQAEENCRHLLLQCLVVYQLGCMVYSWLGISWVCSGSIKDEIWAWEHLRDSCILADLIPITIMRTVWKVRNSIVFEGLDDTKGFDVLKDR